MLKPSFIPKEAWISTEEIAPDSNLILVVTGKNDRFGSQYSAQMSGFAFCRHHNLIFRFTEFNGDKDSEKAARFCGMSSDKIDDKNIKPHIRFKRHCNISQGKDVDKYFTIQTIQELRFMYYSSFKPDHIKCDVALHIRRGDVGLKDKDRKNKDGTPYIHWEQRYDNNDYYKRAIQYIRREHGKNINFVIFSQGEKKDFDDLIDENVSMYLNKDWTVAFHSLVKAPILVTSISEFAWTAGVLNEGVVYANKRMFRSPLKSWKKLDI